MTWIQWFDYNNLLLFKIINVHYFGTQQVNYQRWQTIVVIDGGGSYVTQKICFCNLEARTINAGQRAPKFALTI